MTIRHFTEFVVYVVIGQYSDRCRDLSKFVKINLNSTSHRTMPQKFSGHDSISLEIRPVFLVHCPSKGGNVNL